MSKVEPTEAHMAKAREIAQTISGMPDPGCFEATAIIAAAIAEAVAAEREQCAKVADAARATADTYYAAGLGGEEGMERNRARYATARNIAAAIRARGEP